MQCSSYRLDCIEIMQYCIYRNLLICEIQIISTLISVLNYFRNAVIKSKFYFLEFQTKREIIFCLTVLVFSHVSLNRIILFIIINAVHLIMVVAKKKLYCIFHAPIPALKQFLEKYSFSVTSVY